MYNLKYHRSPFYSPNLSMEVRVPFETSVPLSTNASRGREESGGTCYNALLIIWNNERPSGPDNSLLHAGRKASYAKLNLQDGQSLGPLCIRFAVETSKFLAPATLRQVTLS